MASTPIRVLHSDRIWQIFAFPSETQDQRRRQPRRRIQELHQYNIGEEAADKQIPALDNRITADVALANNAKIWCTNLLVVDYNPGTRGGQETFKQKNERIAQRSKV